MEAQKTSASDGMLKATTSSGKEIQNDKVTNDGNKVQPDTGPGYEIYEPVERRPEQIKTVRTRDNCVPSNNPSDVNNQAKQPKTAQTLNLQHGRHVQEISREVISMYEDLWSFKKDGNPLPTDDERNKYQSLTMKKPCEDEPIYDEVDTLIPSNMCGAKIIPIEEPASAYDEVVINDSHYLIPSKTWDSDSDACESDFDDEGAPNYFGDNLGELYEAIEKRKIASPTPRTVSFANYEDMLQKPKTRAGLQEALRGCLPISFTKNQQKTAQKASDDDDDTPSYVDPNPDGATEPRMPPISTDLSVDEVLRHEIVNKILASEATYKEQLNELLQIEEDVRERGLLEPEKLDEIFCSLQDILQCHEMFSMVLAVRMNEWTVSDKLGDLICASFSTSTIAMAYTEFVNNFSTAIDTYRAACKSSSVFAQFLQAKEKNSTFKISFHALMLKPFERFPEFIMFIQDLLEVTPVDHRDRVPLQLALTQLECLAETINLRRRETEMKNQVKYLDSQISQLNKPLSSSGRVFIRQDDMVHCLIDGVSVVGTKKLRLVLLSDMLLCLSPIRKGKGIVSGFLNGSKYKYKLKWNVPLSDVEFVEYGAGVSVAAGKYGTTTTYSDQGKYRQATVEIQNHIENLQHDLVVIGQIAGLASLLRGKHQLIDQQRVEKWYKSVENTIAEELKAVNMFWLEISLPTRSGEQNYVFNLSSPTVKEEWEAATRSAKLALESRNNPGWYLPDDEISGGVSILRRNMPLLAEFFDLFIFNTKFRVEDTLTYPVDVSSIPSAMAARGLGHFVWVSARGESQGHVTILRIERNSTVPRFVESFDVCPGTIYSMVRIPAMNSRADQRPDRYHTKYGFPFPTVWLGSHSSRIYIYDASTDERNQPLMELKLRDAPLAMKFAKKKIYVGLANGTLAIFRSNTSGHWNLVQPSILPLGRFPVAVIADVKDKLWCGSGSQIYVVSKKGDRIQRIIAVDSNMKNLVKQIVSSGVGVWVSVWRKASIKLYHAETCEMMQEVNVLSPVMKMKNDVDSQVQYLTVDKISITALLVIPGFLWIGTSLGLILLYPLPKLQGVPRVIGRACVAFHAHSGPVRSLFAIPEGVIPDETADDDFTSGLADENAKEIERKLSLFADSEDSVESDEDFFFVDDAKSPSPKKKSRSVNAGKFKVTLKKPGEENEKPERERSGTALNIPDKIKVNDFALMMETFNGFSNRLTQSGKNVEDEKNVDGEKNVEDETNVEKDTKVKSFKNRLFTVAHPEDSQEDEPGGDFGVSPMPGNDDSPSDEKPSVEDIAISENGKPEENAGINETAEGNFIPAENVALVDDDIVPGTQSAEEGDTFVSGKKADTGKKTLIGDEVLSPGSDDVAKNVDTSSKVEPIYVNIPRILDKAGDMTSENAPRKNAPQENAPTEDASRENVLRGNVPGEVATKKDDPRQDVTEKTKSVDNNGPRYASPKSIVEPSELPVESPETPNESDIGDNAGDTSTPSLSPAETPQELYTVVLPNEQEAEANGVTPSAPAEPSETGPERSLGQSARSSTPCLSYLVVSAGEGHVDLRMKRPKLKVDVKKDTESRLLIWRVNSKT